MIWVSDYCRSLAGHKLYKAALDAGFTCPNRDGKAGWGGCIFCSEEGAGEYAGDCRLTVSGQLASEKERIIKKLEKQGKRPVFPAFIAYFQAFTNTYAPTDTLRALYEEAVADPDVFLLSIATRPDCLQDEVIDLLAELNRRKPVWVELGLQTMHEETAHFIRRGYELSVYDEAVRRLHEAGIEHVITHLILGLPGENEDMMLESVRHVCEAGSDGIKLQNLQVLMGTDLAAQYENGKFELMDREAYIRLVARCLSVLPEDMVVHRITGDPPREKLIAPLWCTDKKKVMNGVRAAMTIQIRC